MKKDRMEEQNLEENSEIEVMEKDIYCGEWREQRDDANTETVVTWPLQRQPI